MFSLNGWLGGQRIVTLRPMRAASRPFSSTVPTWIPGGLLLLFVAGTALPAARAQLLAYDFGNFDVAPTFQAAGISGGDLARDGNFNGTTFNTAVVNGSFGSPAPAASSPVWTSTGFDPALFYTFTLTATGNPAAVTGLFLDLQSPAVGAGGGPTGFAVRSSLDGFTANLLAGSLTTGFVRETVALTAVVAAGQTLEVRIYGFGATDSAAILNLDNVSVVPEPAAVHALLAAGLACAGWNALSRRRRERP